MTEISACKATHEKYKCTIRHKCRRYDIHLNATSKYQSYIKPNFNDCENFVELNENTYHPKP